MANAKSCVARSWFNTYGFQGTMTDFCNMSPILDVTSLNTFIVQLDLGSTIDRGLCRRSISMISDIASPFWGVIWVEILLCEARHRYNGVMADGFFATTAVVAVISASWLSKKVTIFGRWRSHATCSAVQPSLFYTKL